MQPRFRHEGADRAGDRHREGEARGRETGGWEILHRNPSRLCLGRTNNLI